MRIACTAEPFGYGPSSSLAQIVSRVRSGASMVYRGHAHTLDFAHAISAYERVEECAPRDFAKGADAALIVTDFEAAQAARDAGIPFAIYDPLAWYWREIPAVCRDADLYLCQDFFGVRARVAGMGNAVVVPPLTPEVEAPATRDGILISLGGLGNPYFTAAKCADYARAVLAALRRAIAGETGPVTSLTSKQIAATLPGVSTLPPAEVHRRIAAARVCFLTPGLGQLYEASALGARAVWLPPANDSQGRQLREVAARGMAIGAIDWHEFMDVPRVDYHAEQAGVMQSLASHMERLLRDERAQDRLAAVVRARMILVRDTPSDPLGELVVENGRGGAAIAARVLEAWVKGLGAPYKVPRLSTRAVAGFAPLAVPRENRIVPAVGRDHRFAQSAWTMIDTIKRLHAEVDGTGFNTLAGALEVARKTRTATSRPRASDFAAALTAWRANSFAMFAKYGAGNCTTLAEVLRARIQRETGLTGHLLAVRYADSKRPLEHAWEYAGTVHTDVLVPFVDASEPQGEQVPSGRGDEFHAVHVVCGMGVAGHVHVFDEPGKLMAHLDELGYTRGAVVDGPALTRAALGTKDKLWIVEGPEVGDGACKLGVDVIRGSLFLNGAAAARHTGPRPARSETVGAPLAWANDGGWQAIVASDGYQWNVRSADALRELVEAIGRDFRQPADFADNLMFLARNLDAWCEATLCEPGRSLRKARERAADRLQTPSTMAQDVLGLIDEGHDLVAYARIQLDAVEATLPDDVIRARHGLDTDADIGLDRLDGPEPDTHYDIEARFHTHADIENRETLGPDRLRGRIMWPSAYDGGSAIVWARRLREHADAIRALPHAATQARHAMATETHRLLATLELRDASSVPLDESVDPRPSVLDPPPVAAPEDDTIAGLRFDSAKQTYVPARVPAVAQHALHLRLAQLLDWEIELPAPTMRDARDIASTRPGTRPGHVLFSGAREVVDRLVAWAIDDGESLVDPEAIAEIVTAIGDAAPADDPRIAPIASAPVDLWLSASGGGDKPERLTWRLPAETAARIYALLDDAPLRTHLFSVARTQRAAQTEIVEAKRRALAAVLEQHRGVPRRHKRVHWAFLNLASAGQTVAELRRPDGVLPRDATSLDPVSLRARYASTPRLALRFVLDDRFELNVLGDARYWDTIARWGFPPNHETLAGTRPILASGYLTIERGRIVAIEDDGVMVPGKLPSALPPIQEVLEALGFDVDLDRVAGASLVVDWDGFADAAAAPSSVEFPEGDARAFLASRSHGERPALVVALIRRFTDRDAATRATAEALRGFRLINVSAHAIATGDLPKGAEWIDEALARYLVRKVLGR